MKELMRCYGENEIKAIIFDCDGVLVDTEGLKFSAWKEALKDVDVELTNENYAKCVGYSAEEIAKIVERLTGKSFNHGSIIERRHRIYLEIQQKNVPIFYNAANFLKHLISIKRTQGFKLALASSGTMEEIETNFYHLGIKKTDFDFVASGTCVAKNKPAPDIYKLCLEKLGISDPKNAIVFEDSGPGAQSASNANIPCIVVWNEFTKNNNFNFKGLIHKQPGSSFFENLTYMQLKNFIKQKQKTRTLASLSSEKRELSSFSAKTDPLPASLILQPRTAVARSLARAISNPLELETTLTLVSRL